MPRLASLACLVLVLGGCSTPYHPPSIARGSAPFPGIAALLQPGTTTEIVVVHGMCTHTVAQMEATIATLSEALQANVLPPRAAAKAESDGAGPRIGVVLRDAEVAGAAVHYTGLVWSPLTEPLKRQLAGDRTGTPNDCASVDAGQCRPARASLNGSLKDGLLDDCLSDAIIYQGESRNTIRRAMIEALTDVARKPSASPSLAIVAHSLGSKMMFDALAEMLQRPANLAEAEAARSIASRLAVVYMQANQLPLLGLAEQDVGRAAPDARTLTDPPETDSLLIVARARAEARRAQVARPQADGRPGDGGGLQGLTIVAFTDPNDLLSWRLLDSRYRDRPGILLADVLVSNAQTWFGIVENPYAAHVGYEVSPDVGRRIACGDPLHALCR